MNGNASGKVSLLTVGGIGIVGTLLGTLATAFLLSKQAPQGVHREAALPAEFHAIVTLYDGNKCIQRIGNIRYAYPVIRPRNGSTPGDTLDWQGRDGRNSGGHTPGSPLSIDVEFNPPSPNVDSPFASYSFKSPTGTTGPTPSSGEAVGSANDYDYLSVTVDGVPCKSWDPGVHVDQ